MKVKNQLAKLIDLKSIVTFLLTLTLTVSLLISIIKSGTINNELLVLFSTSYGAIITYFFTKKDKNKGVDTDEISG